MIAILGSGFGLYGYLPALAGLANQQVLLPMRYRARFAARRELVPLESNVVWVNTEDQALDRAECVVIALRPIDQRVKVHACLSKSNIRRLILEKPLAATEADATLLLQTLIDSGRPFRIGYTFCQAPWAEHLRRSCIVAGCQRLEIKWHFMAHHFRTDAHNWKRVQGDGGGPLRFYGIQALALFAQIGYDHILRSKVVERNHGDARVWTAKLAGPGLPIAELTIDTQDGDEHFIIVSEDRNGRHCLMKGKGPFDDVPNVENFPGTDRRVPLLYQIFHSLDDRNQDDQVYRAYGRTQKLWLQAERSATSPQ